MVFDPMTSEERKQFLTNGYAAQLPGYTGHCPTLKFRVGKRFGADTQDIMKELLEKRILRNAPHRANSGEDAVYTSDLPHQIRKDYKSKAYFHKLQPFILGYTGYIPGFNNKYGLPFMRAVEEGGKEWRDKQSKLRHKRDAMRAHKERLNPRNLVARARADNVEIEIDHGHNRDRSYFGNEVSPEKPPIVGYTGHIPGARSEVALSRRYAQAARKGLEFLQKERESRRSKVHDLDVVQAVRESVYIDDTGYTRA